LCEAEAGFGDPLLLGLRVFFALCHVFNSLRRLSTYIYRIRQPKAVSTKFDVFRQPTALLTGPGDQFPGQNTGSGT
jgi:hypothetical protein